MSCRSHRSRIVSRKESFQMITSWIVRYFEMQHIVRIYYFINLSLSGLWQNMKERVKRDIAFLEDVPVAGQLGLTLLLVWGGGVRWTHYGCIRVSAQEIQRPNTQGPTDKSWWGKRERRKDRETDTGHHRCARIILFQIMQEKYNKTFKHMYLCIILFYCL